MVPTLDSNSIVKLHSHFEDNIRDDVSVRSNQEALIEFGKKFVTNWQGKEVVSTWDVNKLLCFHPDGKRRAAIILFRDVHVPGVVWFVYSGKENVFPAK